MFGQAAILILAVGRKNLSCGSEVKCGVTLQAQIRPRSFGTLAEGGALPRRMELLGPQGAGGVVPWLVLNRPSAAYHCPYRKFRTADVTLRIG
jgi:hypothetical protein